MSARKKIKYENAVTEATRRFMSLKEKTCGRMPVGILDKIIKEVKQEHGVSENISAETVRSRIKRKNITGKHQGTYSPIAEAEKYIAETIIQMAKIKSPLSVYTHL